MNYSRISSFPIKIFWCGFETDTLKLQQYGWQISAEQLVYERSIRLSIKHCAFNMYGITKKINIDYYNIHNYENLSNVCFEIIGMSSRYEIRIIDNLNMFEPVDCLPSIINEKIKSIEDFKIFRPIGNCNDIIIEPHEVSDLMSMIIEKQSKKQKEIREKKRREIRKYLNKYNGDTRSKIYAQIIAA